MHTTFFKAECAGGTRPTTAIFEKGGQITLRKILNQNAHTGILYSKISQRLYKK
jgi:hypothetical protein